MPGADPVLAAEEAKPRPAMKRYRTISWSVLLIALVCTLSCTQALWDRTDPKERVWIPSSRVSEEKMKEQGVEYTRVKTENYDGYLVERSSYQKLLDHGLLTKDEPREYPRYSVDDLRQDAGIVVWGSAQLGLLLAPIVGEVVGGGWSYGYREAWDQNYREVWDRNYMEAWHSVVLDLLPYPGE